MRHGAPRPTCQWKIATLMYCSTQPTCHQVAVEDVRRLGARRPCRAAGPHLALTVLLTATSAAAAPAIPYGVSGSLAWGMRLTTGWVITRNFLTGWRATERSASNGEIFTRNFNFPGSHSTRMSATSVRTHVFRWMIVLNAGVYIKCKLMLLLLQQRLPIGTPRMTGVSATASLRAV